MEPAKKAHPRIQSRYRFLSSSKFSVLHAPRTNLIETHLLVFKGSEKVSSVGELGVMLLTEQFVETIVYH